MPDRTDSGQGRDALDAAMDALEQVVYDAGYEGGFTVGGVNARTAARAAVRKAAREMGEEYTVKDSIMGFATFVGPLAPSYHDGDRVRVVKVVPDA